jgi:hypothetical protein
MEHFFSFGEAIPDSYREVEILIKVRYRAPIGAKL